MRSTLGVVTVVGLMLCSCAPAGVVSGPPAQSSRPATEVSESPQPSPSEMPPITSEPTATPFGAAVFNDPDECANPRWRVAYPEPWYSDAEIAHPDDPAAERGSTCYYFAPRDFVIVANSEPSPDIAIMIDILELPEGASWDYGPTEGHAILSDEAVTVDGYPARVQEDEVTVASTIPFVPVGDRSTIYIVELGDNRYLFARTTNQNDYRASRRVLAAMMQTLEVVEPEA